MNQRIIYPTDDGGVSIIVPADCALRNPEQLDNLTVMLNEFKSPQAQ